MRKRKGEHFEAAAFLEPAQWEWDKDEKRND